MCTRELNGGTVEFGTSGYTMDQVFVLYDRDSDSIWYPQTATTLDAVGGVRKGESIDILDEPAPQTLGVWMAAHPNTTVLLPTEKDIERLRSRREHEH